MAAIVSNTNQNHPHLMFVSERGGGHDVAAVMSKKNKNLLPSHVCR
jgi:hypothetical protein